MKPWKMMACGQMAEIDVTGVIGGDWYEDGVTAKAFAKDLKALGDVKEITLRIFSPGGSVMEGHAIFNALAAHPAKITAVVDFAASMATVIAMAADEIHMAENAFFMIHNPWSVAMGDANDMRKTAKLLDDIKAMSIKAYQRHSKMTDEEIGKMMDDETWMTADEAIEAGFVTQITPEIKAAAYCDVAMLKNVPEAAQAFLDASISGQVDAAQTGEGDNDETSEAPAKAAGEPAQIPEMSANIKAKIDEAYEAGEAAGIASAQSLVEKATIELSSKLAEMSAQADKIREELEASEAIREKLSAKIESMTAGFEYKADDAPKSSDLRDHPFMVKLRELKQGGMTDQQAQVEIDKKFPNLRQSLIQSANRK